jgi:hypothetical protein
MTYSIDVINLCFHHLHSNKTKKTVAKILEISINTINYWVCKYYSNYINKELITNETIIEYKKIIYINRQNAIYIVIVLPNM